MWDLGFRELISTEERIEAWSRLDARSTFVYKLSSRVDLEAGGGGYYTFQNDDVLELRLWQGVTLRWPEPHLANRRWGLHHRLRLEERWTQNRGSGQTDIGLRFRYRLATFIPLDSSTIENATFYVPLVIEYFGDIGSEVEEFFAARARVTLGLGHVLSPNWSLEARYTAQSSRDTVTNSLQTTDHIFDFRIRTSVRIRDLGRTW